MNKRIYAAAVMVIMLTLVCSPASAQVLAKVKGKVVDPTGVPMANATVEMSAKDTGRKYSAKTDKNGEYFTIGVAPGTYTFTLSRDGKVIFTLNNINVSVQTPGELNTVDFDLVKEAEAAKGRMTEAQRKELEKQQKEVANVKNLNNMLKEAAAAQEAGNFDQALQILTQATQIDPNRDLLWARLGEVQLTMAKKESDRAAKKEKFAQVLESYKKAIDLLNASTAPTKPSLGAYYNNEGEAYAGIGQTDDAIAAYTKAAQVEPEKAGNYYYNLGATLTNAGKVDDAIAAFDKALAADPTKAEAYYWKGVNMIGKATMKGNTMVAPEGTAEAFNRYLSLAPDGAFAQPAKDMLAAIGAKVDTSYKAEKPAGKKK
jgi:tetratricopeptide (TPR) repeat protein